MKPIYSQTNSHQPTSSSTISIGKKSSHNQIYEINSAQLAKNHQRNKRKVKTDQPEQKSEFTNQNDISLVSKRTLSISNFTLETTPQFPTGLLGKGTFGEVLLMRSLDFNERFAMKILRKKDLFQHDLITNLKQEIRIQKQLSHQNIAKLYNNFEDHENVYLILEFCNCGNLQEYIRNLQEKLSEKQIYTLFIQVCKGIAYLHSNGIIHRDLKPENILIDENFTLKVSDFGFSTELSILKQSFVGTMAYMSPEMLSMGEKNYTSKIDIWGLGIVLFQLIEGEREFFDQSPKIQHGVLVSNNASPDLKQLLGRLLEVQPEQRCTLQEIFSSAWMQRMSEKGGIASNIKKHFESQKKSSNNKENNVWDSVIRLFGCSAPRKENR